MSERRQPPNRRRHLTLETEHRGQKIFVSIGLDKRLGVLDAFGTAKKPSTEVDFTIADACILISIAMQRGAPAKELLHSMHTVPVLGREDVLEEPASVIGKVLEAIVEVESEITTIKGGKPWPKKKT